MAYYGLFALQHRGQENAGIAVNDEGVCTACCDEGLVNEGFPKERIKQLGTGNIVVGHVRQADRRPGSHDFRPLRVEETSDRRQHQAQSHLRAGGGKAHHADQRFHRPGNDLAGATDLLCRAGAKEIRMRVSAPPFVAPCCCGTDIDDAENLIANRHTGERKSPGSSAWIPWAISAWNTYCRSRKDVTASAPSALGGIPLCDSEPGRKRPA